MKALTVKAPNRAEYIETEKPCATGNMLVVEVEKAGICATDFAIYSGESSFVKSGEIKYPVRFGHEWSGTVESVGSDVVHFKPGDRVFSDSGVSCGVCSDCKMGNYGNCKHIKSVGTINTWDGCFAEYMLIPEFNAYHIPKNVTLEEAALIEPAAISLGAFDGVKIQKNMSVAVVGVGAIGMSAVWLAKYFGVDKVIAIGRTDGKLEIAKKIGADFVINNKTDNAAEKIIELTNGGADMVIETSGSESALIDAISMTKKGGTIPIISFYEKTVNNIPMDDVVINCLSLSGVAGNFGNPLRIAEIMSEYDRKLTPIITHRVPFDKCIDVFENEELYSKNRIKVMVDFD